MTNVVGRADYNYLPGSETPFSMMLKNDVDSTLMTSMQFERRFGQRDPRTVQRKAPLIRNTIPVLVYHGLSEDRRGRSPVA